MTTAHEPTTRTVRDYMTTAVRTIGANEPLTAAHRRMRRRGIRHLPVLEGGRLVGLVSMRDLHLMETLQGVDPEVVTVGEAMTPDPYAVGPDAALREVAAEMARRKYGSALVVEAGRIVGIFTATDGLRALAHLLGASRGSKPAPQRRAPKNAAAAARKGSTRAAPRGRRR